VAAHLRAFAAHRGKMRHALLWARARAGAAARAVRRMLMDSLMGLFLRNGIIYNVAWEDPRVDGELLQLGPDDRLLVLTTGGCNVLDRLLDGPEHIVAVDLNPAQNALLELKLAAARSLTHDQFFELFGCSNRPLFDSVYRAKVRPLLSAAAAAHWDAHGSFFDDVMYAGAAGTLARALRALASACGLGGLISAIRAADSIESQRALCDSCRREMDRFARLLQAGLPLICPFAGVPASQLDLLTKADGWMAKMLNRVFHGTFIARDNYFWYGYLYGRYSRECCPRYLRPEHFPALRARTDRVSIRTGLLHEVAQSFPDGYFTCMVLLDHMDWLTEQQVAEEWATLTAKLEPKRGRVLWRSFSDGQHLAPLACLNHHTRAVAEAERRSPDRVGTYNSTHLATVPAGMRVGPVRQPRPAPVGDGMHVGAEAAELPANSGRHAGLYRSLPRLPGGVWVDVGGGLVSQMGWMAASVAEFGEVTVAVTRKARMPAVSALQAELPNLRVSLLDLSQDNDLSQADDEGGASISPLADASADMVSLAHGDGGLTDAELPSGIRLATRLLRPGGLLAISSISPPCSERRAGLRDELCECATELFARSEPRLARLFRPAEPERLLWIGRSNGADKRYQRKAALSPRMRTGGMYA
jgi:S-adenosylmethionine-diacylglycerol 3-amino-3-carboxypropyl transferase